MVGIIKIFGIELNDSLSQNDRIKGQDPVSIRKIAGIELEVITGLILNLVSLTVIFGFGFALQKNRFFSFSLKSEYLGRGLPDFGAEVI